MTDFWNDLEAIKEAIKETEDKIERWIVRAKLNWNQMECEEVVDALYEELIDLCIRRDELDDHFFCHKK